MACTYTFDNETGLSYSLLLDKFKSDASAASVLFSLEPNEQIALYDKINSIKQNYDFRVTTSTVDTNPDIEAGSFFTVQTFVDSGYFKVNGEAPMFQISIEDFLKELAAIWKQKEPNLTLDQIDIRKQYVKDNWNRIAKDALDLHKIINSYKSGNTTHFYHESIGTSFLDLYTKLELMNRKIREEIVRKLGKKALLLQNLNIEAPLRGTDKKIIGHIDFLYIRQDGTIDIYNLKASTDPEVNWGKVKKEKFKHELALIKRILEANGISGDKIRLNLVPVRLKYDETYLTVVDFYADSPVLYDSDSKGYNFKKYDVTASNFIDSKVDTVSINSNSYTTINKLLAVIFPYADIKSEGIKQSAKAWLDKKWRYIARRSSDGGWDLKLPDRADPVHISDPAVGSSNQEALAKVLVMCADVFDNSSRVKTISRLVDDIRSSYNHGYTFLNTTTRSSISSILDLQILLYFKKDGLDNYQWELLDVPILANSGLLLFRNYRTSQLDIIDISTASVDLKNVYRHRNNLLAPYLRDMNTKGFTLEGNYGNIEAVRTLTILNEILPQLPFKPKLGTLKVVGMLVHNKKGVEHNLGLLLPQFNTIIETVSDNTDVTIENNFRKLNISSVDPASTVIDSWSEFIESNTDLKSLDTLMYEHTSVDGVKIDGLDSARTSDAKIYKLEQIIDNIKKIAEKEGIDLSPEGLIRESRSMNKGRAAIASIMIQATRALNLYHGDLSLENEDFSKWSEYLMTPLAIPNTNVRTVAYMFLRSIDKIANNVMSQYAPIKRIIMLYYKDKGFTAFENSTWGHLADVFKNLYELDDLGKRTMRFKNPYDSSQWVGDLRVDREFLKHMLFHFNKIRAQMRGTTFTYTGIEDPKLIANVNKGNYLNVPLERASAATRRTNMVEGFRQFGKETWRRLRHPGESLKEFEEGVLNAVERDQREHDFSNLLAYNPFLRSESDENRIDYILEKGADYFEYNVENLIIDFLEKHVQTVEYNKMLTRTRGILLDLKLRGEIESNDGKTVMHAINTINDFLSVAVYDRSIMEDISQKIEGILAPIRHAVSNCYIAGNVAGGVRDTVQGLAENMTRALIHYQTNIKPSDVTFGYKEVISDGFTNVMSVTKLTQLNLKFRISNLDVARISEGLKTGRGGITNLDNIAYLTLRRPDYLNRMVLLVAQMHQDGCYDAYFINTNGELEYDWKKDKRFEAYAKNDKSDPEAYGKARALYLNMLRIFNQERGLQLKEGDALPDAYTSTEVGVIKNVSDSIYGSYNKSTRGKYENIAIGRNFAFFSTFMNGIVNNYFRKPQLSNSEAHWEQQTVNGEKMYFNANGEIVPESDPSAIKSLPVMDLVPTMIQGIAYTLKDICTTLFDPDGNIKRDIWSNEKDRANIRKLISDISVSLIIAAIFKLALDSAYKEHKKKADGNNIVVNAIIEVLYNGSANAWDGFHGPLTVLNYLGNLTNPATYKLSSSTVKNLMKFVVGDETFYQLCLNQFALPRSFKNTYTMWARENGK